MLDNVQNIVSKQNELVCYQCSGVDLYVVQPEDALWKLNGKLVPYSAIKNILQEKVISEDESRTTHFWGKRD